jgi:membrane protein YqaA with SNARE-associated domain
MARRKKNRETGGLFRNGKAYFFRFSRKGGVGFLKKNLSKFLLALIAFAGVFALANHFILTDELTQWIETSLPPLWLVGILFISECFLGILPPDLFIWALSSYQYPYLWVLALAIVSYVGGIISFYFGTQLFKIPRIHRWVEERYVDEFKQIRKYGGLLISIAALTPLPFSPVSLVSGVVHYPLKKYLVVALMRFVRFFLYAFVIFEFPSLFQ